MRLCTNLLASDTVNYEYTMIYRRAVNGFICAIAQAFVKLISNVTAKAALHGVWVHGGGIVPDKSIQRIDTLSETR